MKIKSRRDFVSGLVLAALGATFAVGATNYLFGTTVRPGPGYFPFGLGVILALLGLLIFAQSFAGKCEDGDPIGAIPWRPLLCIVGALVFFGFFLSRLGFLVSFPAMIVLTCASSAGFSWKEALFSAFTLTALSYLIFILGLQLSLPLWPAW